MIHRVGEDRGELEDDILGDLIVIYTDIKGGIPGFRTLFRCIIRFMEPLTANFFKQPFRIAFHLADAYVLIGDFVLLHLHVADPGQLYLNRRNRPALAQGFLKAYLLHGFDNGLVDPVRQLLFTDCSAPALHL